MRQKHGKRKAAEVETIGDLVFSDTTLKTSSPEGSPLGPALSASHGAAPIGLGSDHNKTLLEGLHTAVSMGWACDLVLKFEDDTDLWSVKWIWMLFSEYFRCMLTTSMKEGREDRILLRDVSGDAVRAIFRSLLTGELLLTNDNVAGVLDASDRFMLPGIKESCARYLSDQLAPQNFVSIMNLGERYGFPELRASAAATAALSALSDPGLVQSLSPLPLLL